MVHWVCVFRIRTHFEFVSLGPFKTDQTGGSPKETDPCHPFATAQTEVRAARKRVPIRCLCSGRETVAPSLVTSSSPLLGIGS